MSTEERLVVAPQHLSLVLSGAISLGAYHAGAVSQLGYFVTNWNEEVFERRRRGEAFDVPLIYIDVVSAASAGAMTGAILVKYLATSCSKDNALRFVQLNRDIWCGQRLAFDSLLDPANTTDASFLSDKVIDALANENLFQGASKIDLRYGQTWLVYTCTMTSLNPIAFDITVPDDPETRASAPTMVGTTHRDWITFRFSKAGVFKPISSTKSVTNGTDVFEELASKGREVTEQTMWSRLGWSAMTSGAFPFAWQPVQLDRFLRFYPAAFKELNGERDTATMTYTDGGVLNNMPLDRAFKVLSDSINFATEPSDLFDNRTYVLIECNPASAKTPTGVDDPAPRRLHDARATELGGPLFEAIREQSFYADLKSASTINTRLEHRAEKLWPVLWDQANDIVRSHRNSATAAYRASIEAMLPRRPGRTIDVDATLLAYEKRESVRRFIVSRAAPSDDLAQVKSVFVHLALMNDIVADLHDKHRMVVMRIRPQVPLYGQMLGSFGGFLSPDYQLSDFGQAIADTQVAIRDFLDKRGLADFLSSVSKECLLAPNQFKPVPRVPAEQTQFDKVPPEDKDKFFGLILNRVGPWMTRNFGGNIGQLITVSTPLLRSVVLKKPLRTELVTGVVVKAFPRTVRSIATVACLAFLIFGGGVLCALSNQAVLRTVGMAVGGLSALGFLASLILFSQADQEARNTD